MHESASFQSHGDTVEGLWFRPEGPGPHPTVVMAGGWCYVKELVQPRYAQAFARAGVAALIFDYRRLGASGGTPRQHLDPWAQIEDYRNAISYVETRDDADPDRIAVWGISYSGGHVLVVGGLDPRVKCLISIVPVIDGYETMRRAHGTMGFRRLRAAVLEDRRTRFLTGEYGYMKHSSEAPETELCTWPFPASPPLFQHLKETEAPAYENRNTIESAERLMEYDVRPYVSRLVDTPTLLVLADNDDFTFSDLETTAFNAIPTPDKRLVTLDGTSHHEIYRDPAKTKVAADTCIEWFDAHLR
ncbi:MAG: alpha/beta fold hydrolase [Acidimicrobiales bacterium]